MEAKKKSFFSPSGLHYIRRGPWRGEGGLGRSYKVSGPCMQHNNYVGKIEALIIPQVIMKYVTSFTMSGPARGGEPQQLYV